MTERRMDTPPQWIPDRQPDGDRGEIPPPRSDEGSGAWEQRAPARPRPLARPYEPPVSALGPLFLDRLERVHICRVAFTVHVCARPTLRVLGGYYKRRRLVRVYSHDSEEGRRP